MISVKQENKIPEGTENKIAVFWIENLQKLTRLLLKEVEGARYIDIWKESRIWSGVCLTKNSKEAIVDGQHE